MGKILPTTGIVRLVLLLFLLIPSGFGYSVFSDFSGKLVTEQLHLGKTGKPKGASFLSFRQKINNRAKNKATFGFQLTLSNHLNSTAFSQQSNEFDTFKNNLHKPYLIQLSYSDDELVCLM